LRWSRLCKAPLAVKPVPAANDNEHAPCRMPRRDIVAMCLIFTSSNLPRRPVVAQSIRPPKRRCLTSAASNSVMPGSAA
jgi:hypothetical protein